LQLLRVLFYYHHLRLCMPYNISCYASHQYPVDAAPAKSTHHYQVNIVILCKGNDLRTRMSLSNEGCQNVKKLYCVGLPSPVTEMAHHGCRSLNRGRPASRNRRSFEASVRNRSGSSYCPSGSEELLLPRLGAHSPCELE